MCVYRYLLNTCGREVDIHGENSDIFGHLDKTLTDQIYRYRNL